MIRINGTPVIELSIHLPMNGAWSADVHCLEVTPFEVGSLVTLSLPENDFIGRVDRCAAYSGRLHVRVIGGSVDWQESVSSQNYGSVAADQLISEMGIVTDQPIGSLFPFWSRIESTKGITVQTIAKQLGVNWRTNPDSTLRIRAEDFQSVDPDAIEVYRDESGGMIELAVERATVLPGTKVGDDLVGDTVYVLQQEGRLVCRYWTEGRGRLLERYVRAVTRDTMYFGTYPATVAAQASDGSLDLIPDDTKLKGSGLNKVRLRHGLPGCEVKVPNGERVSLSFDNGDPTKPYAAIWDPGTVNEISLGGSLKVAMAELVKEELTKLKDAISNGVTVPNDGGASLKTTILAALVAWPSDVSSEILGTK